jgi:hypothetical protein
MAWCCIPLPASCVVGERVDSRCFVFCVVCGSCTAGATGAGASWATVTSPAGPSPRSSWPRRYTRSVTVNGPRLGAAYRSCASLLDSDAWQVVWCCIVNDVTSRAVPSLAMAAPLHQVHHCYSDLVLHTEAVHRGPLVMPASDLVLHSKWCHQPGRSPRSPWPCPYTRSVTERSDIGHADSIIMDKTSFPHPNVHQTQALPHPLPPLSLLTGGHHARGVRVGHLVFPFGDALTARSERSKIGQAHMTTQHHSA